jgi:hypothetical protein
MEAGEEVRQQLDDEGLIHSSQTAHGDVKDEANIAGASSLPTTLGL